MFRLMGGLLTRDLDDIRFGKTLSGSDMISFCLYSGGRMSNSSWISVTKTKRINTVVRWKSS
jgi:hypothetical protein